CRRDQSGALRALYSTKQAGLVLMITHFQLHRRSRTGDSERGAALVVALIFAAAISVALGSYLALARTTLNLALRSYYQNAAMNLAETGLERGMRGVQMHKQGAADAWTSPWTWDLSGADPKLIADNTATFEGNINGSLRVVV